VRSRRPSKKAAQNSRGEAFIFIAFSPREALPSHQRPPLAGPEKQLNKSRRADQVCRLGTPFIQPRENLYQAKLGTPLPSPASGKPYQSHEDKLTKSPREPLLTPQATREPYQGLRSGEPLQVRREPMTQKRTKGTPKVAVEHLKTVIYKPSRENLLTTVGNLTTPAWSPLNQSPSGETYHFAGNLQPCPRKTELF